VVASLVALLLLGAVDPIDDPSRRPREGLALSANVQRLQDEFGLGLELVSPRFLGGHMAVRTTGGVGWYPDLRALPESPTQEFGAVSLYGHVRAGLELSTGIALFPGRLYAVVGPSFLFLSGQLSSTSVAVGVYSAIGAELFAGNQVQAFPFSFFFELGGVAHSAKADIANRAGVPEVSESTVVRPIGTGFAMTGGVRFYFW
jgi:hypothetical protein